MKTKLLILLIFATGFLNAQILNDKSVDDVVNIPDPYFKALMLHFFDTNNDNEIQVAEAEAATGSIYMDYTEEDPGLEQSLVGIEAFINITGLHIHYCPIEVIDLSQNLALEVINCSHNNLTSLTLGNNTTLKELDCGDNLLTSIDVNQNTGLEVFDCRENELTNIDLSNNIALTYLRCQTNHLSTIDVTNNSNLVNLGCSNNDIESVDVSQNLLLELLFCGLSNISTLDVSNNHNLVWLWCNKSQLTSLDLSNNPNIKRLKCSENLLTSLDVRNENNTNFVYIIADSNPDLSCIFVDDIDYSTDHWLLPGSQFTFDSSSHFVENQEQCDDLQITTYDILEDFKILPNPIITTFKINTINKYDQIKILNTLGQTINYSKEKDLYFLNETSGVYYIQITTKKGVFTKKIIKQ